MDEVKQVLYLSYDGMTDPLGQSQVLPYIIGLSKYGYSFTLISCEKPDRLEQRKSNIEKICAENNIDWKPLIYHKSPPILSTIYDVYQMRKTVFHINKTKRFSLVHCRGYLPALVGLQMKEKFGTKFIFDMRGFWADEKVDAGAWSMDKWHYKFVYKFFKRKEKEFFLKADCSVSLTHTGKKEILSWEYMQGRKDNISVIPCCADTDLFDIHQVSEADKVDYSAKLKISVDTQVLTYLGSIGTWYMLEDMLDFFVEYKKTHSASKFLFITHDEHDRIQSEASKRGISHDILLYPAMRGEVPKLIALSTHSIFFIRPTYSKMSSSPTKQGELMAMGVPIICNEGVGDTDSIVHQYRSGVTISSFTEKSYQEAIEKLQGAKFNAENIRVNAKEYFGLNKGIENYLTIYKNVC